MSRTTRKTKYPGHWYRKFSNRKSGLRDKSAAKTDREPGIRTRTIPPDPDWVERVYVGENNQVYRVATKLTEKRWGVKRIVKHLQQKYSMPYQVALEIAEGSAISDGYLKSQQGPVTSKDKKRKIKKQNAEKHDQAAKKHREAEKEQGEKEDAIAANLKGASEFNFLKETTNPFWIAIKGSKKLQRRGYRDPLDKIRNLPHRQDISEWKPRGKTSQKIFNNLANYLFAEYPSPEFLWSVFFSDLPDMEKLVIRIAQGESLFTMCKSGEFPLPLTRKQCHVFLGHSEKWTFVEALRHTQIITHEGNNLLLEIWMSLDAGKDLNNKKDEIFYDSVLKWFCLYPMFDMRQLGPMMDYIQLRKRNDGSFAITGRSPIAMLEGMNQWHAELGKTKILSKKYFPSSGLKDGEGVLSNGIYWRIKEILTSIDLLKEGRAQRNCVYSYADSVSKGVSSIWSLTIAGQRQATIQVRNKENSIVQVRGKCNRMANNKEKTIIKLWAQENVLKYHIIQL